MELISNFIATSSWTTLAAASAAILIGVWLLTKVLSVLRWVVLALVVILGVGYYMTARGATLDTPPQTATIRQEAP